MILNREEKLARLRLWRTPRVGPATFRDLLERFGSAVETLNHLPDDMASKGHKPLQIFNRRRAIEEIERLHQIGGRFLFCGTPEYSNLLSHINDAPPILASLGNIDLMHKHCIAIVGARNASLNGKNLTRDYAKTLGEAGFAVVSGLAKGIDTAAHQAALASGTIAVVAGGIDVVYPRENQTLYEQIADQGLILSEQPLGMATHARLFPLRNRLVSGLAIATLVMEANARSGSLITARLANEQGRDVFAVPGSPLEGRAQGTNDLIKQGASLVTSAHDIINAVGTLHDIASISPTPEIKSSNPPHAELNSLKFLILENVNLDPVAIDDLALECQVPASEMQTALTDLEVAGLIVRQGGGLIVKTP